MLDAETRSAILGLLPGDGWTLRPVADGHNLVVRATAADRDVAVRIQPVRRMSQRAAETLLSYLQALAQDPALRVPQPLRLADGSWFARLHRNGEEHRCALLAWVPGERIEDARVFVEPERLRTLGATVARLHTHARRLAPDLQQGAPKLSADVLFAQTGSLHHRALREELGEALHTRLIKACDTMATALHSREDDAEQIGLIHADLEPQNWVFDDDQPGVIDFDEYRRGPYALDLLGVLWTHAMWDEYPVLRASLFEGYERVRPLPPRTREDADVLVAIVFFVWIDFVYGELSASARVRHRPHVRPMVSKLVAWCGVT